MADHGINVSRADTAVATPNAATCGIPFVIGTAPLSKATGTAATAGTPVLCTSYTEAVEQLGYDDDWKKYTVCEVMYYHFKLCQCQPVIFLPVGETAEAAGVAAAVEQIELCLTMFGIVPDLILAPGFSSDATVAAAMAAKAGAINGMFFGKALVDISAKTYTAAVQAKNSGTYDGRSVGCWPNGTLGDLRFHASTVAAGTVAETDTGNSGIPYESPSNKTVHIDGLCDDDGNAINLTYNQANVLNNAGICTFLNFMGGWTFWGNYTLAYPKSTDVKDYFIPISRMFDYVSNTLIKTFWSKLDKPMNRRLIDTILDSANIWLNGLVGAGYLLGARVEMLETENPLTSLMAGKIKLHVYMTPPSPAQEIDFVLEYDADYVTSALQS